MLDPLTAGVSFLLFGEGSGEVRTSSGSQGSGSGSGLSIELSMAGILAWLTPEMLRGSSSHNCTTIQWLYPLYQPYPGETILFRDAIGTPGFHWKIAKSKFWRNCFEENDCKTWYVCFIVQPSPFAMRISFFRIFTLIFVFPPFPPVRWPPWVRFQLRMRKRPMAFLYVQENDGLPVCVRERCSASMCKRPMVSLYV